jgi:beta-lactamase class A
MSHIFYDQYALSQIPPYVQTASKQGMVDDSRSELVMVNAPHGDYVFYVATKNNKDQRWKNDNEASELERKVSSLLWNYFEPKYGWTPQEYIK